jgi:hypothetical protein
MMPAKRRRLGGSNQYGEVERSDDATSKKTLRDHHVTKQEMSGWRNRFSDLSLILTVVPAEYPLRVNVVDSMIFVLCPLSC